MAKKLETIKLIASLEKAARQTKKPIWSDLVERLNARSRASISVNVEKIDSMAKANKGKVLLVPGKVLSQGELNEKVIVVAVSASENAKAKINAVGEFIPLIKYAQGAEKVDTKKIIIVK